MTIQNIQFKRGSTSEADTYVGPPGSITLDMQGGSIRIHDGTTPGGKFKIDRGAVINQENLTFVTAEETQIAAGGQTLFTLAVVQATDPSNLKITRNGTLVTNWTLAGNNQVQFDVPLTANDVMVFQNLKTLETLIAEALGTEGGTIDATVQAALEGATSVGGIMITDIATSDDIAAVNQSIQTVDQKFQNYIPASDGIDCGVIE